MVYCRQHAGQGARHYQRKGPPTMHALNTEQQDMVGRHMTAAVDTAHAVHEAEQVLRRAKTAHERAQGTADITAGIVRHLFGDAAPVYVTRYEVTRHYGGPEEGGWWYDWHASPVVEGAFPNNDAALAYARERSAEHAHAEPDRFSVAGGADVEWLVEDTPGEYQSTDRPYYC